jgi:RNA polymerase sigma-70 factor, ECF subfamily
MTSHQEQQAARLIVLAQQGDGAAYAELLTLLAAVAKRFARNRLGNVPWLDDIAQETLVTVHKARHTYDVQRPFAPWFYAILSSRLIDVVRRERRIGSREVGTDVLPETTERPPREPDEDFAQVEAALDSLPERQREIVRGLKLREESVKDLSQRMGMSESAVKVTAHRGYRALRRLLRRGHDED